MNCPNCGTELKDGENFCPFCQSTGNAATDVKVEVNSKYEEYKETESLNQKYGFNKLLILSALELFCCSQPFGIIALVLVFLKLKPAIEERDLAKIEDARRVVRIVLIIGLVLGIIANVIYIGVSAVASYLETSSGLYY